MSYDKSSHTFGSYTSDHFNNGEFACHCKKSPDCFKDTIVTHPKLVELLDKVREHFGKPVTINSSIRCPEHNKAVGGASKSEHMTGEAADIVVQGIKPSEVHKYINDNFSDWNGGIGLGSYNSFTHVDVRGHTSRWNG